MYIIAIICIASLIPFFVVSIYSRPCVDDFTYSAPNYHLINSGNWNIFDLLTSAINIDINKYQTWQGLYTSAFVLSLQPGIFGEQYYFIGFILLSILIYICLFKFVKTIKHYFLSETYPSWLIALVVYTILFQGMPNICQGLYWFNGAWNYTPFFFLDLVIISSIIEIFKSNENKKRNINIVLASILSFLVSGGNHITSVLNIMILFIACVYAIAFKKNKKVFIPFAVSLVGFAIMYFAPGTAIRQEVCNKSTIIQAVINSTLQVYRCICKWIDIKWILLSIVVLICLSSTISHFNNKMIFHPIFVVALSILILIGMYFPPYYAMSEHGDLRIYNIIWLAFMFLSYFDVIYIFLYLKATKTLVININSESVVSCLIVLVTILYVCFIDNNFDLIRQEFEDNLPQKFSEAFDDRIVLLERDDIDVLEVDPLPESKVLKFDDIYDDITSNRNNSWKNYYGKRIKLKDNYDKTN